MAYLYFTVVAVILYFFSDWVLNKIEQRIGKRLEYRSVIFFMIIAVLALGSFSFIETLMTPPEGTVQQETPTSEQIAPASTQP
ncbi:MAG: hypothetical protein KAT12_03535 [Gammaproteobacteria bacterium]|nr:hypothetical protein [Gammaproteobacteria bacterium]